MGIEQVGIGNQMTNEKVQNQVGERSLCLFFIILLLLGLVAFLG